MTGNTDTTNITDIGKLATNVITLAKDKGVYLTTAESCTGGMLAAALTDIAGASQVFSGGFITYANAAKINVLGVPQGILAQYGAVSGETAKAMAEGAHRRMQDMLDDPPSPPVCVSLAITGIAGPTGGTNDKPVGLVWFGLAMTGKDTEIESQRFTGGRDAIRTASVHHALRMLVSALAG
ncbi:MAG: CinA family protein [Proteobacteria bacterium]|nr:CinA family protein [Pseudomonadota bacterium]